MNTNTFAALGCNAALVAALDRRGYTTPMPVQAETFKAGLEGRDLLVQSQTGSGKTLAFGLPLIHRLTAEKYPQALILAPTRELAQQVGEELRSVDRGLNIALLVGGTPYPPQMKALHYGASIVVGTPGRVMDHLDRGTLDLSKISMVVLDECDEMLNMGFIEDVEKILAAAPKGPQTYLFSATLPPPIASLAKRFLKDPVKIQLSGSGEQAQHEDISHAACLVPDHARVKALVNLLLLDNPSAALIFTKTKAETEEVAEALTQAGLSAAFLHGDLVQASRTRILNQFKAGKLHLLVATDVAARGLDIGGLPLVVHLGIPHQLENYIHRSGRTGRAGAKGTSMSLVAWKESRILMAWARRGGLNIVWRPIPQQSDLRTAAAQRLAEKLKAADTVAHRTEAESLLATYAPVDLVSKLLNFIEREEATGFDIPEEPARDRVPFKRESASRPFSKQPFDRNEKKPFEKKPFEKRPYEKKPFEKKSFEKKPFEKSPYAAGDQSGFKPKPKADRPTGTPFKKKS